MNSNSGSMKGNTPKQQYKNPGHLFIEQYGVPKDIDTIFLFADFLRQKSGISDDPPIDLARIYARFGIKAHLAPLVDQPGFSDGTMGFMCIKEDDPATRQRFTQAHELIEFLFSAYKAMPRWNSSYFAHHHETKEKYCQRGAAALLMPRNSFVPAMMRLGVNMDSASILAGVYQTSLMSTLHRVVEEGTDRERILIIWHFALKATEDSLQGQPSLFGNDYVSFPQAKLRIWWSIVSRRPHTNYIPNHQSISKDSFIFHAYETGLPQNGIEAFNLKGVQGRYHVEARRVKVNEETCVLSLLCKQR